MYWLRNTGLKTIHIKIAKLSTHVYNNIPATKLYVTVKHVKYLP